jgi:hypothetical protein
MPATFGEQGVLLERGLPAVLLSIGGERPPPAGAPISRARLESFGRAALRTVTVLDGASPARPLSPEATSADLLTSRKVVPGWALRLFTGALLLAVALTVTDALAALLRRREPVLRWLRWTLVSALPFALVALLALALGLTGLVIAPGAPVSPQALPAEPGALLAAALVFALGWVMRPAVLRLARSEGDPADRPAGVAVVLVAVAAATLLWIGNPYAAALVIPALHVWLFALAPDLRMRRPWRLTLVALAALPVVLVAAGLARAFELAPAEALWQGLLLTAGGHISAWSLLLWSVLAGCAAAAVLVAARARGEAGDDDGVPITVRGPASYAGPGSLGGTKSALRR